MPRTREVMDAKSMACNVIIESHRLTRYDELSRYIYKEKTMPEDNRIQYKLHRIQLQTSAKYVQAIQC